ncbi:MAG TPA: phage holin family protein [Bacilli bacterium]
MNWLWRLLIGAGSLLLADLLLDDVYIRGFVIALLASLILGLVNIFVRPVLVFFTLPVTFLTFGLFLLVVNALTFWLASGLVPGFEVHGFWAAFWGALITAVINGIFNSYLEKRNR